ncbi:MAG: fluoride efflux transporter FluC [Dermatophilaceae bacterium]
MTPADAALVAIGAAAGAPLRYLVGHRLRGIYGATAASGTLVVNVAGSLVLGMLVGAGVSTNWLTLVGAGFCGALTTFSALALEVWEALHDGPLRHVVVNVTLSASLGIGAATLGWALGAGEANDHRVGHTKSVLFSYEQVHTGRIPGQQCPAG